MVGRVSSFGLGQTMMRQSMNVQVAYANANKQKASGLKASTYGELGTKASSLIFTESTTSQLTVWKDNTQTANDRVQSMYAAVGNMIDKLTNLRSTLASIENTMSNTMDFNELGSSLLTDMSELMNTRQDGRYLFAGGNTDTAPVNPALLTPVTAYPTSADNAYYTGDSEIASVRVSRQQNISYGVTGNSPAFEQTLRVGNILANMVNSPVDTNATKEAYSVATQAIDGLIALQTRLSTASKRLESAQTRQVASLELMDSMASNLKEVDIASVTVKMSEYDTQLQASYSALGSLSKYSLTRYLS